MSSQDKLRFGEDSVFAMVTIGPVSTAWQFSAVGGALEKKSEKLSLEKWLELGSEGT